jgi:hypothetical protein
MRLADSWFDALGHPICSWQRLAAVQLLETEGYDRAQACVVVAVIAREMEHDEPERACRYARSFVYDEHPDGPCRSETLVLRVLAALAAPNDHMLVDDLRELEAELR